MTKTTSKSFLPPDLLVQALRKEGLYPIYWQDNSELQVDWSNDLILHLILALECAEHLKVFEEINFNNRELVIPSIERALREALYVRQNQPPEAFEDKQTGFPIQLTRFGHIEKTSKDRDMG